ncbi:hypothetical protein QF030_000004 [Streptomyces rishiriensis]|uniref:Uncharacterized protein n=1 Tax=Streptomyces rishiriensis TaxID=68264 RepID=A0ABU0NFH9_STRRH|nr:hypothetical protein [Streptomyces rishiriensis]
MSRCMPPKKPLPPTYKERLLAQLDVIESDYVAVLKASDTEYVDSIVIPSSHRSWGLRARPG